MKKWILFLTAFALGCCLLAGCSKAQKAPKEAAADLSKGFSCEAVVQYNGITANVEIERSAPGLCKISFLTPDILKGTVAELSEGQVKVSYKGLGIAIDENSIPVKMLASALNDVFDAAARTSGIDLTAEKDNLTVTGQTSLGEFTMELDKNTGKILNVEIPAANLAAELIQFDFH